MAKNYQKFHTNYIKRQHTQFVNGGRILERNWSTVRGGNVLRFGFGKQPFYEHGGFVFTQSTVPDFHKKHNLSVTTDTYMYDDVVTSDGTVNEVKLAYNSTNLADYAYWGSCEELIRSSVENIVANFPAILRMSDQRLALPEVNLDTHLPVRDEEDNIVYTGESVDGYILNNIFGVNLHFSNYKLGEYDNPLRYLCKSYDQYEIVTEALQVPIIKMEVENTDLSDVDCRYDKLWYWGDEGTYIARIVLYLGDYKYKTDDDGLEILTDGEKRIIERDEKGHYVIDDSVDNGVVIIKAWSTGNDIIYTVADDSTFKIELTIKPQNWVIDEYFNSLDGFEKQLLREDTNPVFSNTFAVPVKRDEYEEDEEWWYENRTYGFSYGEFGGDCKHKCITGWGNLITYDKEGLPTGLQYVGMLFDEIWCDNLYRNMTHESIKNFDWSYNQEYYEGDEIYNVEGGNRFKAVLRIIGRVFDDLKYYADNIKNSNRLDYSGINNLPNALVSDMLDINGWEITSTMIDGEGDTTLYGESGEYEYIEKEENPWSDENEEDIINERLPKWFPHKEARDIYTDVVDNDFMRRLMLSSAHIMRSKGTQESIEMIMAMFGLGRNVDYEIEEVAYAVIPKESDIEIDKVAEEVYREDDGESPCRYTEYEPTTLLDDEWLVSTKLSDVAYEANQRKNLDEEGDLLYENVEYSGIPLEQVYLCLDKDEEVTTPITTPTGQMEMIRRRPKYYLVPYFSNDFIYDGRVSFQSAGGWGKLTDSEGDNDSYIDSQETLSYLKIVSTYSDLLNMNAMELNEGDIVYVADLGGYVSYNNQPLDCLSHYFCIKNLGNVEDVESWKNIFMVVDKKSGNVRRLTDLEWEGYEFETTKYVCSELTKETIEVNIGEAYAYDYDEYKEDYKRAMYLESIISTNEGNNPHVGYGRYDYGNEFYQYVEQPFNYAINTLDSMDYPYSMIVEDYLKFQWVKKEEDEYLGVDDKEDATEFGGKELMSKDRDAIFKRHDEEKLRDACVTIYPIITNDKGEARQYPTTTDLWYINTKILKIKNLHNEETDGEGVTYYNDYFKSVIMKYLLQVIPSSTILKLYDF